MPCIRHESKNGETKEPSLANPVVYPIDDSLPAPVFHIDMAVSLQNHKTQRALSSSFLAFSYS